MISDVVKKFLKENRDLIEDGEWDQVFSKVLSKEVYNENLLTILRTLIEAGVDPFEGKVNIQDPKIQDTLEEFQSITGYDDNAGSGLGEFAKAIEENISTLPAEEIAKLALLLGYKVYKTNVGYYGYDRGLWYDYVILNPKVGLEEWFNWNNQDFFEDGEIDDNMTFDPSEYQEMKKESFLKEDLTDVAITDNSLTLTEPTKEEVRSGLADMINNLIKAEYDAVTDYNNAITTVLAENKYTDLIDVFQDILEEENLHIGQLQRALKEVSEAAENINKGEIEADKQLN